MNINNSYLTVNVNHENKEEYFCNGLKIDQLIFDSIRNETIKPDWVKYTKYDLLHRVGGPAVEYASGSKEWHLNGVLHRDDGPAVDYVNGDKYWYQYGKLHRIDGPAVERPDGTKSWYQNGVEIIRANHNEQHVTKQLSPASEAIYRVTAVQLSKILSSQFNQPIRQLLTSSLGMAMLNLALGQLPFADSRLKLLSEEFRIAGLTNIGDFFTELLVETFNSISEEEINENDQTIRSTAIC